MIITKTIYGAYNIIAIINGYLVQRQYFGYSKREALRMFKNETKGKGK